MKPVSKIKSQFMPISKNKHSLSFVLCPERHCRILIWILPAFLLAAAGGIYAQRAGGIAVEANLYSPDHKTELQIGIRQDPAHVLVYKIRQEGKDVLEWSELGWISNKDTAGHHVQHVKFRKDMHREVFSWRFGAADHIINNYNRGMLHCFMEKDPSGGVKGIPFEMEWRVFDGSVAFRYQFSRLDRQATVKQPWTPVNSPTLFIQSELTAFRFKNDISLFQYNQESVFMPMKLSHLQVSSDLPSTLIDSVKHMYYSIGEADNENYTRAVLKRTDGAPGLGLHISYVADKAVHLPQGTWSPWRTVSLAHSALGLLSFSNLYLKLVTPESAGTPQWIKPGKLIRSALDTESGRQCVDFAQKHHFKYVLFDAGWYGKEFRNTSDPKHYIDGLDIPGITQYASEKGIGIILYVNYVGLRQHLDEILPLYKKWGIAGLKFGFVDGLSQKGIQWLNMAINKATKAGFILDIHDNYKPTGLSRKYPALLTQEGIRGDENSPDAFHTTTLPFTRFLAGPADFTFCFPNSTNSFSKNLKVSKAQQMALTVIYCSPLQSIFWYGKPEDYTNDAEIAFFDVVPTVWDETRYLQGDIGRFISIARRSGKDWFIGNAAGPADWESRIKLDFLTSGKHYEATIYTDTPDKGVAERKIMVKKGMILPLHLKATGGEALILKER